MVEEDWPTYKDKVKRYFGFSLEEKRSLVVIILLLGFMYSFKYWWVENSSVFGSLIIMTIASAVAILVHISAQRLHAIRLGYKPELRMWVYGLLGGLAICLLSHGAVVLPLFGGTELHMITRHRLGRFRFGINTVCVGLVALMGPLANLLTAYILKLVNAPFGSVIIEKIIILNLLVAVLTMLPIPPLLNGARMFFWSRLSYVFNYGMIASAALLIWISNNFFLILTGSVFIGAILWFVYYIAYEEEAYDA